MPAPGTPLSPHEPTAPIPVAPIPVAPIPVALTRCADYAPAPLQDAVREVLQAARVAPAPGTRVLVKPNLLAATPGGLACTHPAVVRAACVHLLDLGCRVTVGDSPAFGSANAVARRIGLTDALRGLGVDVVDLGAPRRLALRFDTPPETASIGVSRHALDADMILSVPRLKAHCQMRATASVKNLFGVVPGTRKAVAHTRHGDSPDRFAALIVQVLDALPPCAALADGVVAMHRHGPRQGGPFPLGLVGASAVPAALDTALYALLGLAPADVPLWRELARRGAPGARPEDLAFPLLAPGDFDASAFVFPETIPVSFKPLALLRTALQRAWHRLRP
ncbi:MAG: DUF362 domain-containing protein [Desulfovibrionaceae bacterium]|nr:DUF362 domain-containing protein [Desulfovibrionaceae bacterium]